MENRIKVSGYDADGKCLYERDGIKSLHLMAECDGDLPISHIMKGKDGISLCKYIICTRAHIASLLKRDSCLRKVVKKSKKLQNAITKQFVNCEPLHSDGVDLPFEEYNNVR